MTGAADRSFLIHKVGAMYMLVSVTGFGVHAETTPTNQFSSWKSVKSHLTVLGASDQALDTARGQIDRNGTAHLVITKHPQYDLNQFTESPPDSLSKDAKVIWLRSASALAARGVLKPLYKLWFEMFCRVYAQVLELRSETGAEARAAQAHKELHEWESMLNLLLAEMDFASETEFEQFLRANVQ